MFKPLVVLCRRGQTGSYQSSKAENYPIYLLRSTHRGIWITRDEFRGEDRTQITAIEKGITMVISRVIFATLSSLSASSKKNTFRSCASSGNHRPHVIEISILPERLSDGVFAVLIFDNILLCDASIFAAP